MRWNRYDEDHELKAKLTRAFKALRARGYLARQAFMCCGGCAACALYEVATERAANGRPVRGAVYYHKQDNESRLEGKPFHIRFGTTNDDDAAPLAVGRETVQVLREHGVPVEWNDSPNTSIRVLVA